jgi:hypothetical protein
MSGRGFFDPVCRRSRLRTGAWRIVTALNISRLRNTGGFRATC